MDSVGLFHPSELFNLALADKCVGDGLEPDRIIKYYPIMSHLIY